jgi:hypothetical protein
MTRPKVYAIIILLLTILIIPSIVSAAWWNPFSWHWNISNIFSKPKTNISNPATSVPCKNFAAFSDYVLKNILQPDSQNIIAMNKYVITSFRWKRNSGEPFVSYPIINGITASYVGEAENKQTLKYSILHTDDFIISTIKKDSDTLSKNLALEAKNLGLTIDKLNSVSFESSSKPNPATYQSLRTFAFRGGNDLYSIVLSTDVSHQDISSGNVMVTCGRAVEKYDKLYTALNLKADSTVLNPYDNDYVAVGDISPDNTVYALLGSGSSVRMMISDYYYFNGNTIKLVSTGSYPATCAALELHKVGKGMRCVGADYKMRTATY